MQTLRVFITLFCIIFAPSVIFCATVGVHDLISPPPVQTKLVDQVVTSEDIADDITISKNTTFTSAGKNVYQKHVSYSVYATTNTIRRGHGSTIDAAIEDYLKRLRPLTLTNDSPAVLGCGGEGQQPCEVTPTR